MQYFTATAMTASFFEGLPISVPFVKTIYAFTLLKKCFYICSKEVSGNIQILLCFSQWSQKFYPHFRGRPFILLLLEVERRIGH